MRTGSEPATARSALRARFWLSMWGLVWSVFGTAAFALVGRPGWAAACAVLWLVATVDMVMILRHIRQGPHYQPGRDVPPYRPPESGPPFPGPPRHRHP
ncbi:hypothetical protein AV521_21615 [Streptomyces sp. IMTB 2501]|uniref:DUF6343 family protein n=1 Tax=Streptomyces sp. IMTB 2501 TaxID=1776340 RepID=UPI00097B10B5|nr:DUF6343 family protein [Streptomyces sp. IMTB 2501]OLZ68110.1 hypothetical protein AV521_21615 [Streptomyces sp. IMTB 2501]